MKAFDLTRDGIAVVSVVALDAGERRQQPAAKAVRYRDSRRAVLPPAAMQQTAALTARIHWKVKKNHCNHSLP